MASEIATAYVSLVPSFKGGSKAIASEFDGPAEQAGKDAGKTFGGAFGGAFKALGAAGLLLGGAAVLSSAFSAAIEQSNLPGLMKNQFGLVGDVAAESAEIASQVYADGWGQNLGEVGSAVGEIQRQLEQLGDTGDVEELTKSAQALADTFGEEVGGVISSASQLVKTGLAPDMQSAFDIMAAGFQAGIDTGDDFLDTITEYSVQFQNLGLDAVTAFGIINQGLEAGARNSDLVADALKEFSIRATDGTAVDGFKAIGLSAEEMNAAVTEGGPAAAAALDTTLDRLRQIEDPAARDAAAFQIFGTQAEDLGDSLYALDPSTAADGLGNVAGAATDVADAMGESTQQKVDQLSRKFNEGMGEALLKLEPLLSGFLDIIIPMLPVLIPLAVALGVVTVAIWAMNIALAANPIVWIILAIVALIAIIVLLVMNWDWVKGQIILGWEALKKAASTIWGAISDFFVMIFTAIADFFIMIWNNVRNFFVGIWNSIVAYVQGKVNQFLAVMNYLGTLPGKVAEWFQGVYNSAKDKLNSLVDWVKGIPGRIMSALGDLGSLLYNAGRDILEGLLDGIESMWSSIQSKFSDLTSSIPDWKGPEDTDKNLLYRQGRWIIGSLEDGIDDEIPAVESMLAGLTNDIGLSMAPPNSLGGTTTALSDEDRELLRELAGARSRVDVRLGANLTAATKREYAMAVA